MAEYMKLIRPHISVGVRCRVALRQLGTLWPDEEIDARRRSPGGLGLYLSQALDKLAELLGCKVSELRLDHVPALAIRKKVFRNGLHVDYDPPCDSASDLIYRTHADHLLKTNQRGDGAQFPDRVLIKRERRRQKAKASKGDDRIKRAGRFGQKIKVSRTTNFPSKLRGEKRKWPSRQFPKRNKP